MQRLQRPVASQALPGFRLSSWRLLLRALLLRLLVAGVDAGARFYSIQPVGGPVLGDTLITVRGYQLEQVECIFEPPRHPLAPPAINVPCKYSPDAPDVGFRCECQVPPAPRHSTLQQTVDPQTGVISMNFVPVDPDAYLSGAVVVKPGSARGVDFSPFDTLFTYFDLDKVVNVTSIEPSAGHPELTTLVTVHGNGFADRGGIFCSYPGPTWDPFLAPNHEDYEYQDFAAPGTLVDEHTILCNLPPLGNNSDPVFVEVCLSGHPDHASAQGRPRRDDFCTSSLVRFDYVDFVKTNLTLWNSSVLAGPIGGNTGIHLFGKFGFVNFLTLQPEFDGLPDYGRPTCVFGQGLGRGAPRPPTKALAVPAKLYGNTPLRFHLATHLGDNTTVAANSGRRNMCMPPLAQGGDARTICSCRFATANDGLPPCGCGCRDLLARSGQSDFDMCRDYGGGGVGTESDIMCGPLPSRYHRRVDAVPAFAATCVSPPTDVSGDYDMEYAPAGDVRSTSNSKAQDVKFTYYDVAINSVAPLAMPQTGGTRFVVRGQNLAAFSVGTIRGADNIYGVASQIRYYNAQPLCFIGGRGNAVEADLEACAPPDADGNVVIRGWMQGDEEASGCGVLRCAPAPQLAPTEEGIELRISLNGQWDSSQRAALLQSFDNDAVAVSGVTPSAGPIAGGTPIEVHGAGFADLGGAACILRFTSPGLGAMTLILPADVKSTESMLCTPTAQNAANAGGVAVTLGIVLNGDPSTIREAVDAPGRTFYFVDLSNIRISAVYPPAGPIRGGTTLIILGQGLQACAGQPCPQPPLCLFEQQGTGAAGSGMAGPRNVSVLGKVAQRSGEDAVMCQVPSSGLTSEDVTERPLPPAALLATLRVSLLGYVAAPGEPTTLLADAPAFGYFDAAVASVQPSGGPLGGGTELTLTGRALLGGFVSKAFGGESGYGELRNQLYCVFLESPPPKYADKSAPRARRVTFAAATAAGTDAHGHTMLRCTAPKAPASVTAAGSGVTALYVEAALNGYLDEHTASTVRLPPSFTYYDAWISRVHPLAAGAGGGRRLTLFPGAAERRLSAAAGAADDASEEEEAEPTTFEVHSPASVAIGDGIGSGAVRCRAPELDAARKQVHVLLNGELDARSAEAAARLDDENADGLSDGATFTFDREPCEGVVALRGLAGAFDDGLGGAPSDRYGGAERNCTWRLAPSDLLPGVQHSLVITLTAVALRPGLDTLTITDGGESGGDMLLQLPPPTPPADAGAASAGACANATGKCLQLLVAQSGTATVKLHSLPRDDGTSSRLSAYFVTIGPPEDPNEPHRMRPTITAHPFAPSELAYAPLGVRRAVAWPPPESTGAAAAKEAAPGSLAAALVEADGTAHRHAATAAESGSADWPGELTTWGAGQRIEPLDEAVTIMAEGAGARASGANRGSAASRASTVRTDPSRYDQH